MRTPVTSRLDEATIAALDEAVAQGRAPSRGAAVADAVRDWVARHHEAAIIESYRRAYASPDPAHDDLVARIGFASAAALIGDE